MKNLIQLLIFESLLIKLLALQCGREEIEHCIKCGIGEYLESCSQCENKYSL